MGGKNRSEGTVNTQITVTELDDGTLRFDILVLGSGRIGDLRGIFSTSKAIPLTPVSW